MLYYSVAGSTPAVGQSPPCPELPARCATALLLLGLRSFGTRAAISIAFDMGNMCSGASMGEMRCPNEEECAVLSKMQELACERFEPDAHPEHEKLLKRWARDTEAIDIRQQVAPRASLKPLATAPFYHGTSLTCTATGPTGLAAGYGQRSTTTFTASKNRSSGTTPTGRRSGSRAQIRCLIFVAAGSLQCRKYCIFLRIVRPNCHPLSLPAPARHRRADTPS